MEASDVMRPPDVIGFDVETALAALAHTPFSVSVVRMRDWDRRRPVRPAVADRVVAMRVLEAGRVVLLIAPDYYRL